MPSKTFYNLDKEKREKLIEAALNEFSRVEYEKVSINQIIMHANIARGSFYMYFTDKEDLMKYLLEEHYKKLLKIINDCLDKNKGDLEHSFIDIYDKLECYVKKLKNKQFFDNVFVFINNYKINLKPPEMYFMDTVKDNIKKMLVLPLTFYLTIYLDLLSFLWMKILKMRVRIFI